MEAYKTTFLLQLRRHFAPFDEAATDVIFQSDLQLSLFVMKSWTNQLDCLQNLVVVESEVVISLQLEDRHYFDCGNKLSRNKYCARSLLSEDVSKYLLEGMDVALIKSANGNFWADLSQFDTT